MTKKLIDKLVYNLTQKPTHYKEVNAPPKTALDKLLHMQDARQVQYNNWSKARHVYSGSYLPKDANKLENQGWLNETATIIKNNKPTNKSRIFRRKSTNQWVRNDVSHWHWYNWWKKEPLPKDFIRNNDNDLVYLDKYGVPCKRKSKDSHLEGED